MWKVADWSLDIAMWKVGGQMHGHHHGRRDHRPAQREPVRTADPNLRASDHDRDETVRQLSEHTAAGRLTLAEFEHRIGVAYTAERVGELRPLLADLPDAGLPQPAALRADRPGNRYGHAGWQAWGPWLGVGLLCTVIWALTSISSERFLYFWPMWVIGPWGVSMLMRGAGRRTGPSIARE